MVPADSADSLDPTQGRPDVSPSNPEASYLDFLAQPHADVGADFERLCAERPAMAQALRRLHGRFTASVAEAASPISLGFSRKLLGRYGSSAGFGDGTELPLDESPRATPFTDGATSLGSRYEIQSEVARGGMGVILRVWDCALERPLAMKVILAERRVEGEHGPLHRRFLREARVTGRLDHPGVVPVYEIGVDDSHGVFFTMRLIEGRDLRQIFDLVWQRKSGWTRQRALEIVLKVCDTMAYCHEKGVVHRDLKPANIMVGNFGEVYVMDWGLARLAGESDGAEQSEADRALDMESDDPIATITRDGSVLGTPAYMPPEQALGLNELVGPRADVYAVGAMLYALLAGCAPYRDGEASPKEVLEAVRAGPPRSIALLNPQAPVGLVAIAERAMARDPANRFASMLGMAIALREYLEAEQQAAREAERARADAENARRVASFLASIFSVSHPEEARGANVSAREIVDRGAERIEQDLADQPIVQATLKHTLGEIYRNLGLTEPASRLLEGALAMRESGAAANALDAAQTLTALGVVRTLQERAADAEQFYRRALALRRQALGESHALVAASLSDVGNASRQSGDYWAAEPLIRESVALMRRLEFGGTQEITPVLLSMASVLFSQQRFEEAVPLFAETLEILRAKAPASIDAASCANNFGDCCFAMGDFARAWQLHEESVRLRQSLYDARHPATATGYHNQGATLVAWGDARGAMPLLELALEIRREKFGDRHPSVATCLVNLATCALDEGRLADAERLHRQALEIRETSLGSRSPLVTFSLAGLASVLIAAERWDEAEALHERSLAIRRERLGDDYFANWSNQLGLAAVAHARGQLAEARARVGQVLEAHQSRLTRHPRVATARHLLASILADLGEIEAAREEAVKANELRIERLLPTHPARAESLRLLERLGALTIDQ